MKVWQVALGLLVIACASFAVIGHGNTIGTDEWHSIYSIVERGLLTGFAARPLNKLPQFLVFRTVGIHPVATYSAFIVLKAANALLLVLLVRTLRPRDPLFAVACGAVYLVMIVNDFFLVLVPLTIEKNAAVLFTLLALWGFAAYLRDGQPGHAVAGVLGTLLAIAVFEGVIPLLGGAGAAILLSEYLRERRLARRAWVAGGVLLALLMIGLLPFVLPLFLPGQTTYQSAGFELSVRNVLAGTVTQLRYAYAAPLRIEPGALDAYRGPVLVTTAVTLGVIGLLRLETPAHKPLSYLPWAALGVLGTWLGVSPYLASVYYTFIERVHVLALAGTAVAITALVFIAAAMLADGRGRRALIMVGLGAVAAVGAAQMADLRYQTDVILQADWDAHAAFLRSLANQVPEVEENTLILYAQEGLESTFSSAASFNYAMRFLYADRATGLIPEDSLYFHDSRIDDEGIHLIPTSESPIARASSHGWDEVIVVVRTPDGAVRILDELPPDLHTPARATLYDPYARIQPGPIPERAQRLFPTVLQR